MFACCFSEKTGEGGGSKPVESTSSSAVGNAIAVPSLPGCELIRVLGLGSFGSVLLVRERATKALYAIKIMSKEQLEREDQIANVVLERQILRDAGPHPFVVECMAGFQTESVVVLVLEYLSGGDFYDVLKKYGLLDQDQARFYLAEIVMGIGELHANNFALRDLKLENILMDADGHIRLTDFGLSGKVQNQQDSSIVDLSGTAIYQAPEILQKKGHGLAVDWWALGVLAFIMMTGKPPFNAADRSELYDLIMNSELDLEKVPKASSWNPETKDLIKKLLTKNPEARLGRKGVQEVMAHEYFRGIDWTRVLNMEMDPPLPPIKSETEQQNAKAVKEAKEELKKKLQGAQKNKKGMYKELSEFENVHVRGRFSIGLDFDNQRPDLSKQKTFSKHSHSLPTKT